jgi:hypothetical protein
MNEHKTVTEPTGYDYAPTERIPAQGDLPRDRAEHDRHPDEHTDEHSVTGHADTATDGTEPTGFAEPVPSAEPVPTAETADTTNSGKQEFDDPDFDRRDADTTDFDRRDADTTDFDRSGADTAEFDRSGADTTEFGTSPADHTEFRESTAETADFAEPEPAAEPVPVAGATAGSGAAAGERPADEELFAEDAVHGFRERWREVQAGFVDDPAQAVRGANELVDEIMRELAEHKHRLETGLRDQNDTEQLRVVIREYRAFFNKLLNV